MPSAKKIFRRELERLDEHYDETDSAPELADRMLRAHGKDPDEFRSADGEPVDVVTAASDFLRGMREASEALQRGERADEESEEAPQTARDWYLVRQRHGWR